MKKLVFMFLLALPIYASAVSTDTLNAVAMVAYDQSWDDWKGTLALRNNTDVQISNVTYQITYLDMNGKELDYKEFTSEVEIAPGKTKKVNIPAYEHERSYSYYKSKGDYSDPHKFKISFSVVSYNKNLSQEDNALDENGNTVGSGSDGNSAYPFLIFTIVAAVLALGFSAGLYVLVALMAKHRNRNVVLWVVVSLLATPVLAIIILLCIGTEYSSSDDYGEPE